ncbi:MAG: HNH endonuclease signature motif containing protein [Methanogenium sp.]|jgi:hypothetical protein
MAKEKKLTKKRIKQLEKRDRNKRLKVWAVGVKHRDLHKCVFCCSEKLLNAHHIIPRQIKAFMDDLDNGISLCPKHHKFSSEFSAHKNSFAFFLWFSKNRPQQFQALVEKWGKYLSDETRRLLREVK